MEGFLIVFGAVAILAVYVTVKVAWDRLTYHGLAIGVARYLAGHHWSGKHPTNSSFLKPAEGNHAARRFYHQPGWARLLRRSGPIFAIVFSLIGYAVNPTATVAGLATATVLGAAGIVWLGHRAFGRRKHRLTWLYPLHLALAEEVGYSRADRPERWLEVDQDRSRAKLLLPTGCNFDGRQQQAIVSAASAKLAMESPTAKWTLHGQTPSLILKASKPPPPKVTWAEVQPAIEQAKSDELVMGIGKETQLVKVSLSGDSPHIALSMGSGAGKSVTATGLLAQHLHGGGIALVADPKLISLNWARGLPNVGYAGTPQEIHEAMVWLGGEVERRNAVALASADIDGVIRANVGPRLFLIFEELNVGLARLRTMWQGEGGKGRSPAIDGFETVLFAGRQVKVHMVGIAQMLSVRAAGSGEARENFGTKVMGRYSVNAWKMNAADHAMPPSSRTPGRVQVVTDSVRECQTPWIRPAEARQFALSGMVAACPVGMPFRGVVSPPHEAVESGGDLRDVEGSPALPQGAVTLREAISAGVVKKSIGALRQARQRGGFPEPVGMQNGAHYYSIDHLAAWTEAH